MSILSLTYQQSVSKWSKRYQSDRHFSEFYLQDGCKKSTGIDMEQNYVTVTIMYSYFFPFQKLVHSEQTIEL